MRMELAKTIGKRLRAAREESGLNQRDVADKLGLTRAQYTHFETGRTLISLEYLLKLPFILDKPMTYFLGIDDTQTIASLRPSIRCVISTMQKLSAADRRLIQRFTDYLVHEQQEEAEQD